MASPDRTQALFYLVEFDVFAAYPLSVVVNSLTATIPVGTYTLDDQLAAYDPDVFGTTGFLSTVKAALHAASPDVSWSVVMGSDNKITISRTTTFTLDFTSDNGTRLAAWLGFTATSHSGAATYTASYAPYFINVPVIDARTHYSDAYEPDGGEIVLEAMSDGGVMNAVSRESTAMNNDWAQAAESYAGTFTNEHAPETINTDYIYVDPEPGVLWSWQLLFTYARGERRIFVWTAASGGYTVNKLRASGANFRPQRMAADDNTYWIVNFQVREVAGFVPAATLDLTSGGTFSRALVAFYFTGAPSTGSFMAQAASGVRRIEDRGDGLGLGLLMEKAATNYLLRSRDLANAAWTAGSGTLTSNANAGPDGSTLADQENATSVQAGPKQSTPGPSGRVVATLWCRAVTGTATEQMTLLHNAGTALAAVARATSTTYARNEVQATATTNSGLTVLDGTDRASIGGQVATAQNDYLDLAQLEAGYYPTSPIATVAASVARPADVLSYATGSYPTAFLTDGVVIEFVPDCSSAEMISSSEIWFLVAVGSGGNDCLILKNDGGDATLILEAGGADITFATPLVWSRGQKLTITVRVEDGVIEVDGSTSGDGTYTGSDAEAWPSGQTLYIGNGSAGTSPVTGRFLGPTITQAV